MNVKIENHGSIWLARPSDEETRKHLEENTGDEAQFFGGALVVEPRYVADFVAALESDGVTVE